MKRKGKKAEEENETFVVNVGVVEKIEDNIADMVVEEELLAPALQHLENLRFEFNF